MRGAIPPSFNTSSWRGDRLSTMKTLLSLYRKFQNLRRITGAGHVARMGEMRKSYDQYFCWNELKERTLGRPSRRWKNIRIYLRERGWGDVKWIHLAQDIDR